LRSGYGVPAAVCYTVDFNVGADYMKKTVLCMRISGMCAVLFFVVCVSGAVFSDTIPYAPPSAEMKGLDTDLPLMHRLALTRINQYRKAMGLPLWVYDANLSRMGQAHARYGLINAQAGRAYTGHFENKSFPEYTPEGDEAARTSGLSYGKEDALLGLESLIAGTYHRLAFITPEAMRVGVGFSYSDNKGIAIFVSRPIENQTAAQKAPRFVLFPPAGFKDVLPEFDGENPDPRPAGHADITGTNITITMGYEDTGNFKQASAKLTDQNGKNIPVWVTYPGNPSTKTAPDIYAKGVSTGDAFTKNFNSVFIMPKAPLVPGTTYNVSAVLTIGGETQTLAWSFMTRRSTEWSVQVKPKYAWNYLSYALRQSRSGDVIRFESGVFNLNPSLWVDRDLTIRGSGKGKTVINKTSALFGEKLEQNTFMVHSDRKLTLEDLSFRSDSQLVYLKEGAKLSINRVAISGNYKGNYYISADAGSSFDISNTDIVDIGSNWFIYLFGPKSGYNPATMFLGPGNRFKSAKGVVGPGRVKTLN
jgi:hypothetical protein